MESNIKHCIINVAIGGWYQKGQKRLEKSLIHHGFSGDFLTWTDWPNDNYNKSCLYNAKAAAFEEAIALGYTHIVWADASIWAIRNPDEFFDIVNRDGYYFWMSGYNCAQVCSDKCLDYFDVDRDTAETFNDISSGLFGINLENETAARFINEWIQSAKDGAFLGSRLHDNQSKDKRFCFHRQDQSCASIIANKLGMKLHTAMQHVCYYQPKMEDNIIFTLRGI
jgi:hypothetical protein